MCNICVYINDINILFVSCPHALELKWLRDVRISTPLLRHGFVPKDMSWHIPHTHTPTRWNALLVAERGHGLTLMRRYREVKIHFDRELNPVLVSCSH